jgi:hypothetical protein
MSALTLMNGVNSALVDELVEEHVQVRKEYGSQPKCTVLERVRQALQQVDVDELCHGELARTRVGERALRVFHNEPNLLMGLRKAALADLIQREQKRERLAASGDIQNPVPWTKVLEYLRRPTLLEEALELHPDAFGHFKQMLRLILDDAAVARTLSQEKDAIVESVTELYRCCTPIQVCSPTTLDGDHRVMKESLGYDCIPLTRLEVVLYYLERYRGRDYHPDQAAAAAAAAAAGGGGGGGDSTPVRRIEAPRKAERVAPDSDVISKEEKKALQICHDALGISQYSLELLRSYVNDWWERPPSVREALPQVVLLESTRTALQPELQSAIKTYAQERLGLLKRVRALIERGDWAGVAELTPAHDAEHILPMPGLRIETPRSPWILNFVLLYIQALHELSLGEYVSRLASIALNSPMLWAMFRRLVRFLVLAEYERGAVAADSVPRQCQVHERLPQDLCVAIASAVCSRASGTNSPLRTRLESDLAMRHEWLQKSALRTEEPLWHERGLLISEIEQINVLEMPILDERQLSAAIRTSYCSRLGWLQARLSYLLSDSEAPEPLLVSNRLELIPDDSRDHQGALHTSDSETSADIDEELVSVIMEFTDVTRAGAIFILQEYMRQNPGGRMSNAQEILDRLFP